MLENRSRFWLQDIIRLEGEKVRVAPAFVRYLVFRDPLQYRPHNPARSSSLSVPPSTSQVERAQGKSVEMLDRHDHRFDLTSSLFAVSGVTVLPSFLT